MTTLETTPASTAVPTPLVLDLLRVARPAHWVKNVLVVPAALLAVPTVSASSAGHVLLATVAFTLASIAVYFGNDLADRGRDRLHAVKRLRPIASGRVSGAVAVTVATGVLGLLALLLIAVPDVPPGPILAYLVLNVLYCRVLKHVPLVDAGCVAAGFVLRVLEGYLTVGARVATWLLVAVFSLCLLLVLGKRRQELSVGGSAHRPALRGYTVELTDHLIQLTAVLTAVAFLLYLRGDAQLGAFAEPAMLASVPLALFALARYIQAVLVRGVGDPVLVLLRDRAIVGTGLVWGLLFVTALVLSRDPALAHRLQSLIN
ncbi:UbiA prenyltransferase family protein [Dactylosporangium sucinum]|uniref:Decaprenyl-phosphate phosphoribosyltransferase n=1 Tax=Dactylosporangium sucinum TaxID=1424081 RepID=A0A917WHH3_9ACTN|nr:UbiA prenyltransferase family protein [Dactylosporangium sucinum]GGM04475.1 decaprenyl-phosphate phosphoribosyltransferase [Dactylosporangium sucinum]